MPRFFVEDILQEPQNQVPLSQADHHHMYQVLRLKPGEHITVCDGSQTDYIYRIDRLTGDGPTLTLVSQTPNETEPPYRVTLFQGLPKGDKMALVVQKAVEGGVYEIVPFIGDRSVSVPASAVHDKKKERWNRIAAEAAKQAGRGLRPRVRSICSFEQALDQAGPADCALIAWEGEQVQSIRQLLETLEARRDQQPFELQVWIGPEGGFSDAEIRQARQNGLHPVGLGKRIFRTESAGLAVLAMLIYRFNDF